MKEQNEKQKIAISAAHIQAEANNLEKIRQAFERIFGTVAILEFDDAREKQKTAQQAVDAQMDILAKLRQRLIYQQATEAAAAANAKRKEAAQQDPTSSPQPQN
jgi:hypothetical protein